MMMKKHMFTIGVMIIVMRTFPSVGQIHDVQLGCIISTDNDQVMYYDKDFIKRTLNFPIENLPPKNIVFCKTNTKQPINVVFYSDNDDFVDYDKQLVQRTVLFNPQNHRLLKDFLDKAEKNDLAAIIERSANKLDYLRPIIPQLSFFGHEKNKILRKSIINIAATDSLQIKRFIHSSYYLKIRCQKACLGTTVLLFLFTRMWHARTQTTVLMTVLPFAGLILSTI